MSDRRDAMEKHNRLRALTDEALQRAAALADRRQTAVTVDGIETSRGVLLRDLSHRLRTDRFTLAVVGEFSRGKSTLINALLGQRELLPTAIEPATAAITLLTHGDSPTATVNYEDGTRRENV